MIIYRGYSVTVERTHRRWRCIVSPTNCDLPILRRQSLDFDNEAEAVADAKRRVDELLTL